MEESGVRSQESGGKKEERRRTGGEEESFFITNYPDMILFTTPNLNGIVTTSTHNCIIITANCYRIYILRMAV